MSKTNNSFSFERLARVEAMEGWHFWFRGRGILVRELMNREKLPREPLHLELGCGTGRVAAQMTSRGHRVVAVDLLPEGLEQIRRSDRSAVLVRADATQLPFRAGSFEVITALDVIEHVDDHKALRELRRVLAPSGCVIVSVPAQPWLWSDRDIEAGHVRRYTPRALRSSLVSAQLAVVVVRYYQFLLFPFLAASRLLARATRLDSQRGEEIRLPVLNRLLSWINGAEAHVAARVTLPWGSSLVAVCKAA